MVTREYGAVASGGEVRSSIPSDSAGMGATIALDGTDRNQSPDTLGSIRCMKVNAVVVACRDLNTGDVVDHISFSPNEQLMFTRPNYEVYTYVIGTSPHEIEVVLKSSGRNMFCQFEGEI